MDKQTLPQTDFAGIQDLTWVNQKPHPFMIGSRHVAHASDHCGGMLGEESLRAFPCAMHGCGLPYDQHTKGDHVAFVKLTRDATESELRAWLVSLTEGDESWVTINKVDGFAFIEGFQIIKG